MVYAANGGLIVDGTAVVARFTYPQRAGESVAYAEWMTAHGYDARFTPGTSTRARAICCPSGRDDLGRLRVSAPTRGHTTRSPTSSACRSSACELVDPRFYHLDTALAVLDDTTIAYYPPAFSDASRAHLETLFPDAIEVASADAYVFGLNAVSDGRHVVLSRRRHRVRRATGRRRLRTRSASICPSCSRAAAPSSAARWRCIHDQSWTL